uniref:forkhead box protein N3 isoform X1 n=1 Tax=Myxine glutinosa TaxID=7769 RepID=UPI00358E8ADF
MAPVVLPDVTVERSGLSHLAVVRHGDGLFPEPASDAEPRPGFNMPLDLKLNLEHFPALLPRQQPEEDAGPLVVLSKEEDVDCGKMILIGERDEDLTNLDWLHAGRDLLGSLRLGGQAGLRAVSPPPDSLPSPAPSDTAGDGDGSSFARNPNGKPPYSFSCLIFLAIEASLHKRLPVKGIYDWIIEHFPYFVSAPSGWKNSVRHNLSLNKCFKKVIKDRHQNLGRGSLWCVDPGYRPNLIQALNKTPFHPYSHVLNTPPASPDSTRCTSTEVSYKLRQNGSALQESDIDAITAMMMLNFPPEQRPADYSHIQQHGAWGLLKPFPVHMTRDGTKRRHVRHDSECSCGSPLVSNDPNEDHNYGMSEQGQEVQARGFQSLVSGSSSQRSCSSHSSHTSHSISSTSSQNDEPFDLSLKSTQQVENTRAECYTGKSQDDKGRAPTAKGNMARKITTMVSSRTTRKVGRRRNASAEQGTDNRKSCKGQTKRKRVGYWRSNKAVAAAAAVAAVATEEDDEELKEAAGYLLNLAGVKECLETVVSRSQARPSSEKRRRRK